MYGEDCAEFFWNDEYGTIRINFYPYDGFSFVDWTMYTNNWMDDGN